MSELPAGGWDATQRPPMAHDLVNVLGTEISADDSRDLHRQKIARITLDATVQFVGLLDAQGTVLEINKVALDAVGITLADVEGKPFWATFWWQVSPELNAELKDMIARAAAGEFVRWDTRYSGAQAVRRRSSSMPPSCQ